MGLHGMKSGRGMLYQCPAHVDRNPSMKVDWSDNPPDHPVLAHCKAGCETKAVCAAMGDPTGASLYPAREKTKVFVGAPPPPKPPAPPAAPAPEPAPKKNRSKTAVCTYTYTDEVGAVLFLVIRYRYDDDGSKTFSQCRPDGAPTIEGIRRVLYRMHTWHQKKKALAIVEGEKDVETLAKLGLPATTSMGGSGNWRPEYVQQLKDGGIERVLIFPDNDEPGRKYAETVAAGCYAVGIKVKIVALPGLPEKGDVTDWIEAGHTREELSAAAKAAEEWKPPVEAEPLFSTTTVAELDARPVEFLIEGVLPLGWLGAIAGRDGRGKSFFGLEMAKCVLTGEPLFGEFAVNKTGKVLLVLLDDNENLIRERLIDMGIAHFSEGADPKLIIATEKNVKVDGTNNMEVLAQMKAWFDKHQPVYAMIDALYKFYPASKGSIDSANSAAAMQPIISAFNALGEASNCTVALVSHDNKAGSDIHGTQIIRNMYKWILRLVLPPKFDKDPEEGKVSPDRVLKLEKLKIGAATEWGLRIVSAGVREDGKPRRDIKWERCEIERKMSRTSKKAEERQRVVDWLRFYLEDGPKETRAVKEASWADGNKFPWRVVNDPRVADEAGVEKIHTSPDAPWIWRLRSEQTGEQVPAVQSQREGASPQASLPGLGASAPGGPSGEGDPGEVGAGEGPHA